MQISYVRDTPAYPFTDVVLQQLPEGKKLDLLKNLAESSPYTSAQDARQLLPSILTLLKVIMRVLCSALHCTTFLGFLLTDKQKTSFLNHLTLTFLNFLSQRCRY